MTILNTEKEKQKKNSAENILHKYRIGMGAKYYESDILYAMEEYAQSELKPIIKLFRQLLTEHGNIIEKEGRGTQKAVYQKWLSKLNSLTTKYDE